MGLINAALGVAGGMLADQAGAANVQNLYAMGGQPQQSQYRSAPGGGFGTAGQGNESMVDGPGMNKWKCSCGAFAAEKFCPECGAPFDDGDLK